MTGKTADVLDQQTEVAPVETVAATDGFEETTEKPSGRQARNVDPVLLEKLEQSATRNVGFKKTGTTKEIDELRKDLASATVKAKYRVTTGTKDAGNGMTVLTFSASHKSAG